MTHTDLSQHITMLQTVRSHVLMLADDCVESIAALKRLEGLSADELAECNAVVAATLENALAASKQRFRELVDSF